eukprot:7378628-Prymnesium_polylepis.1
MMRAQVDHLDDAGLDSACKRAGARAEGQLRTYPSHIRAKAARLTTHRLSTVSRTPLPTGLLRSRPVRPIARAAVKLQLQR